MIGQSLAHPPQKDELEVTVFGPGVGESILVHCGDGQWISVDSAKDLGRCWALWYLTNMGVAPAGALRLIICTHWHSDHVGGLAEIVESCPNAKFVCSLALRSDEFQNVVARFSRIDGLGTIALPLREVRRVFEILGRRNANGGLPPALAHAHLGLDDFTAAGVRVRIEALSPSDQDVSDALQSFAGYFVPLTEAATGLSPIDQNHASVVVHIQAGHDVILLGADLEQSGSALKGWNAVISSAIRPQTQAEVLKVPYHGSAGAFSSAMWAQMVAPQSIGVLTPFTRVPLPKAEEIAKLKSQDATIYATGLPRGVNVRRRPEVEKTLKEAAPNLVSYRQPREPGIVRLRKRNGSQAWIPELFGAARGI